MGFNRIVLKYKKQDFLNPYSITSVAVRFSPPYTSMTINTSLFQIENKHVICEENPSMLLNFDN